MPCWSIFRNSSSTDTRLATRKVLQNWQKPLKDNYGWTWIRNNVPSGAGGSLRDGPVAGRNQWCSGRCELPGHAAVADRSDQLVQQMGRRATVRESYLRFLAVRLCCEDEL